MGTDMFGYMEFWDGDMHPHAPAYNDWSCFAKLPFFERESCLFAALAGVHSDKPPLIPARGLPKDASLEAEGDFWIDVIDPEEEADWKGNSLYVLRSHAKELVAADEGYLDEGIDKFRYRWDTVSPSWMTRQEVMKALAHHDLDLAQRGYCFQVAIGLMQILEKRFGEDNVRLVFWFGA